MALAILAALAIYWAPAGRVGIPTLAGLPFTSLYYLFFYNCYIIQSYYISIYVESNNPYQYSS